MYLKRIRHNPAVGILAQIMNSRLIASAVNSTDVRSLSDPGEIRLKGHNVNRPSSSRREERRAAALWVASTPTSCSIVRQGFHQLWPQRYKTGLEEFRLAHGHQSFPQVHIR
jgi:hypothetical protein